MTHTDPSHDVVIVGAGASGLWSAIELASDHDVLVLEAGRVGAGASGYAAGFVSLFEGWASSPDAVTHSIARFRDLDGEHGFTFHDRPYVEFAETAGAAEELRETYRSFFDHPDYEIEYCDADELAARWPDRFDLSGFHGGLVKSESGIVDAREYVEALAATARERGVEIRTHTPVTRVVAADGSVTGVETPDGHIEAETVVCAAGAQTDDLVAPFVSLPTRQFVYMSLRVDTDAPLPSDYPMLYARDVWWRPEPGRPRSILVSGGMYFLPERDRPPRSPPTEYLREVETVLESVWTDVGTPRVVTGSYHTCSKGSSITPDAHPVLDAPAAAPDGLVVAAATTAGISISPFTGVAVRSLVTGEEPPVSLEPFRLDRFDAVPDDFQAHGIREMPASFPTGDY